MTHTIAGFATRPYDGQTFVSNAEFHWVPAGGTPDLREVVTDEACNACHGELEAHGGSRRHLTLCQTCHGPGQIDPDSGNSIDFRIMVHKIHRGADLPSVVAGEDYWFRAGRLNTTEVSFADVHLPQRVQNCETCHMGEDEVWNTEPTREVCGSCHDRLLFEVVSTPPTGWENHEGGTQTDDTNCAVCHPSGVVAGYRPISEVHAPAWDLVLNETIPAHGIELKDLVVTNTAPGQAPVVDFTILVDGAPRDLATTPVGTLRVTIAGPNTDYATYWQATIQGTGAEGTLATVDAAAGKFRYTLPAAKAIPLTATGSYTVAMEGNCSTVAPTATNLNPPCGNATGTGTRRYAANNPRVAVAVTDASPIARRTVVADASCDSCHDNLTFHGGTRSDPNYCVMCHNANNANDERVPRWEDPPEQYARSTHLKPMIHAIHNGDELTLGYELGSQAPAAPTASNPAGNPGGRITDFSELRYPNDRRRCTACHVSDDFDLGYVGTLLPSREELLFCNELPDADTTNQYCNDRVVQEVILIPPVTATCVSCHDAPSTAAHAEVMTTSLGVESCATCHDPGSFFGVDTAHRLP